MHIILRVSAKSGSFEKDRFCVRPVYVSSRTVHHSMGDAVDAFHGLVNHAGSEPVQNLGDAVVDEFHDISYGLRTFAFGRDQLVEQVVCNNVVALEVPCIRQELLHVVHE